MNYCIFLLCLIVFVYLHAVTLDDNGGFERVNYCIFLLCLIVFVYLIK